MVLESWSRHINMPTVMYVVLFLVLLGQGIERQGELGDASGAHKAQNHSMGDRENYLGRPRPKK